MLLTEQIGLPLNTKCPNCPEGRLVGRWNIHHSSSQDRLYGFHTTTPRQVLERLGCNRCGRSFEASDRGLTAEEIRLRTLEDAPVQTQKILNCHLCGCADIQYGRKVDFLTDESGSPTAEISSLNYRYCNRCNTVLGKD